MNHLRSLALVTAAALSLVAFAQGHKAALAKPAQKTTITVNGGFSPLTINVKAGQPVQLTFDTKKKGCISAVVFDGMNMKKDLKDGTKTVVTFTPKKGSYAFHCPMNMMKGKIVAK